MEKRLAVILAVDVVGYSRLMAEDRAAALEVIRRLRQTTLEPKIIDRGGRVLKRMGDGWIAEFPTVEAGIDCAIATLRDLEADPFAALRLGLHCGDVSDEDGETYGEGVNIAARLEAASAPGCLTISDEARRWLSDAAGFTFHDSGLRSLKNIPEPVRLWSWPSPLPPPSGGAGAKSRLYIEPFGGADGPALSDELAATLNRQTGLQLVADPDQARYVMAGELRQAGSRWRFGLRVSDRIKGVEIWRGRIEESGEDTFEALDRLVLRIAGDFRYRLQAHEASEIADRDITELNVEELLNLASGQFQVPSLVDWMAAAEPLRRVLKLDPDNFMAMAMLAISTSSSLSVGWRRATREEVLETDELTARAISLAPNSDFAVLMRGFSALLSDDLPAARRYGLRAQQINSSYANIPYLLSLVDALEGKTESAMDYAQQALLTDPQHPLRHLFETARGIAALSAGDFVLASEAFSKGSDLAPLTGQPALGLIVAHALDGDHAQASAAVRRLASVFPDFDPADAALPRFRDLGMQELHRKALHAACEKAAMA